MNEQINPLNQGVEFIPTAQERGIVIGMALSGRTVEEMGKILRISDDTVCKHFKEELKYSVGFLEGSCSYKLWNIVQTSDDMKAVADAAKFLLRFKCKWKEDKSADLNEHSNTVTVAAHAFVQAILEEKERKHDH